MMSFVVKTSDGTVYRLIEGSWGVTVLWGDGMQCMTKTSMAKALFALGGMVEWSAWDESSKAQLAHLNGGQAI